MRNLVKAPIKLIYGDGLGIDCVDFDFFIVLTKNLPFGIEVFAVIWIRRLIYFLSLLLVHESQSAG